MAQTARMENLNNKLRGEVYKNWGRLTSDSDEEIKWLNSKDKLR